MQDPWIDPDDEMPELPPEDVDWGPFEVERETVYDHDGQEDKWVTVWRIFWVRQEEGEEYEDEVPF